MKIGVAADHGGLWLKKKLVESLQDDGHEIVDFGARQMDPGDDFSDYVIPLARSVSAGEVERGIAVCGSGVGACIAANKVAGARACLIEDSFSARQGVEDDDMNIICLGGRITGCELARDLVQIFLKAEFKGVERFRRRLEKIARLEARNNDQDGGGR